MNFLFYVTVIYGITKTYRMYYVHSLTLDGRKKSGTHSYVSEQYTKCQTYECSYICNKLQMPSPSPNPLIKPQLQSNNASFMPTYW